MLSDELQCMADFLSPYRTGGTFFSPDTIKAFVARLNDMSARAHELEGHIVPDNLRRTEPIERDNIVSIERARKQLALTRLAQPESST